MHQELQSFRPGSNSFHVPFRLKNLWLWLLAQSIRGVEILHSCTAHAWLCSNGTGFVEIRALGLSHGNKSSLRPPRARFSRAARGKSCPAHQHSWTATSPAKVMEWAGHAFETVPHAGHLRGRRVTKPLAKPKCQASTWLDGRACFPRSWSLFLRAAASSTGCRGMPSLPQQWLARSREHGCQGWIHTSSNAATVDLGSRNCLQNATSVFCKILRQPLSAARASSSA